MPPLLLRRRPAPAPLPPPRAHSLSETSEILSPRSPLDKVAPPPQSLQRETRYAEAPPTRTATRVEISPADAIAATSRIQARQDAQTPTTIPGGYGGTGTGLDPGTVVGITLGAVGGFVLFLWLIYWCINLGRAPVDLDATSSVSVGTASVLTQRLRRGSRHRSSQGGHRRHHHRSPRETVEIRTSSGRPYIVGGGGVREVVVEETTRGASRGPPPVVPRPPRVVDDEDEVVVIEEHSPPRRHRSSRRSSSRRDSGDPRVRRSGGSRR